MLVGVYEQMTSASIVYLQRYQPIDTNRNVTEYI
jgi:hypothetical protein